MLTRVCPCRKTFDLLLRIELRRLVSTKTRPYNGRQSLTLCPDVQKELPTLYQSTTTTRLNWYNRNIYYTHGHHGDLHGAQSGE